MLKNIKQYAYVCCNIKIRKTINAYVAAWALIPSNILKALINNKKQRTVKKNENSPKKIFLLMNEKFSSVIKSSLSKIIAAHINIDIIINFTNEFKSFLSSRRPRKKNKEITIIKLIC